MGIIRITVIIAGFLPKIIIKISETFQDNLLRGTFGYIIKLKERRY